MQKTAAVQIVDWDFTLSELDRHLVEYLAKRVITPFGNEVRCFQLEIVLKSDRQRRDCYVAKCRTFLASGKVVETVVCAAEKKKIIGTFSSRLRTDLKQRFSFESSAVYRAYRWAKLMHCRLVQAAAKCCDAVANYTRQTIQSLRLRTPLPCKTTNLRSADRA